MLNTIATVNWVVISKYSAAASADGGNAWIHADQQTLIELARRPVQIQGSGCLLDISS